MLADNLRNVRETIASALGKRTEQKETGDTVCLVAVTKNHPADVITEIEAMGVGNVGEHIQCVLLHQTLHKTHRLCIQTYTNL